MAYAKAAARCKKVKATVYVTFDHDRFTLRGSRNYSQVNWEDEDAVYSRNDIVVQFADKGGRTYTTRLRDLESETTWNGKHTGLDMLMDAAEREIGLRSFYDTPEKTKEITGRLAFRTHVFMHETAPGSDRWVFGETSANYFLLAAGDVKINFADAQEERQIKSAFGEYTVRSAEDIRFFRDYDKRVIGSLLESRARHKKDWPGATTSNDTTMQEYDQRLKELGRDYRLLTVALRAW